ncbi:MAG: LLM class F420-dependent oxidoreductase [Candidatus Binatia bacterium]
MKIGLIGAGVGAAADPEVITVMVQTAERCGFHSLWAPEHVVLVDQYASKYPYSPDGRFALPTQMDFLDPFSALTFAAAHSKKIRLGTGICLLPEHNPVVLAKVVAGLDKLSQGRFDFGVGIGWLAEEFTAVGVPWERRAARTREYLQAMKLLWTEEQPEFTGEFCRFPKVRMHPKPVQKPHPPIVFGGESNPALKRVAEVGDGWFGFNTSPEEARARIARIHQYAQSAGRGAVQFALTVSPGLGVPVDRDMLKQYRDAGAQQVIVGAFGDNGKAIQTEIERLAEQLVVPAARL